MFWLGLILATCFVPGYTGITIPSQWAVLSALLPLGLWRVGVLGPSHYAGLAALAWSALSLTWAYNVPDAVWGLWLLSIWAGAFWLGSTLHDFEPLLKGLAAGLAVSTAAAIAQHLGYAPTFADPKGSPSGLFYNSTVLAANSALVLIALVSHRLWLWTLPLLPALWLANSRGAFLVLVAVYIARQFHWLVSLTILTAAAIIFISLVAPGTSDYVRLSIWGVALHNLNLLGHGIGSFAAIYYVKDGAVTHPEFAHNDYIQLWFELGIGAVAIYFIYATCLLHRQSLYWPTFLGFAIYSLFWFPLYAPLSAFLGALVAGRIVVDWGVVRSYRRCSGSHFLSRLPYWRSRFGHYRREAIPLEPLP